MNIFEDYLKKINSIISENQKKLGLSDLNSLKNISLEIPPNEFNFDLSCNAGMVLAKINKVNPKDLSTKIKDLLIKNLNDFKEVEIAGPGFLNIRFSSIALLTNIKKIFKERNFYGAKITNNTYNIEFVSANPTGPLHIGHCRGAIYGDVLANLLIFNGNKVTKEYYINDYGKQIENFVTSVFLRIRELKYKEKFINKENLYPGTYIIEIARKIIEKYKDEKFKDYDKSFEILKKESLYLSLSLIKSDLQSLGIKHDNFFSETEIVKKKLVEKAISQLKKDNFVIEGFLQPPKGETDRNWKKTKKLIFKSTLFGDDTDRSLQKNDQSWTYFANDVAYHLDKVDRNFDYLINILGADHTGYIKRITAAVSALSKNKTKLNCKVCQLVKLFKKGKPFKMSKRAGDFISVQDLLSEVDKDSIRFMLLNRSNDVEIDFDFDKVLEKSKENPVYYVQYAYARINSLFRNSDKNLDDEITYDKNKLELNDFEIKILRKIFEWPKIVDIASSKLEPHRIPFYLYELATLFHSYWSKGNKDQQYKFIEEGKIKRKETLSIIVLVSIVIQRGMSILGVSLPNKM